jgi:hypothetical protein
MEIWSYQRKCRSTKVLSQQLKARLLVKESKLMMLSVKLDSLGKSKDFTGFVLGTVYVVGTV